MKTLVVDDDVVSREKLGKIMEAFGDCHKVESGAGAVEAFNAAWSLGLPFDLVLLDIGMPDVGGIEVLKQIRQVEKNKAFSKSHRAKVVMVTTHSDKNVVVDCMKAGCNNYIVKPFNRNLVEGKLSEIGLILDSEP